MSLANNPFGIWLTSDEYDEPIMPFQITTHPFGPLPDGKAPLTEYLLEHTETGEFISIIPEYGGILRRLVLRKGHDLFALLRASESPQALQADESYASALLYPFASRIRHGIYTFEGEKFALKMNETQRDNALHGFVNTSPFSVVDQKVSPSSAGLTIRYTYTGDTVGYPFPFALTVTYALVQANQLREGSHGENDRMCAFRMQFSAQNIGPSRSPAAFGWHPYFMLTRDTVATAESIDEMTLSMPARTPIKLNDDMIPEGDLSAHPAEDIPLKDVKLDTPFRLDASADGYVETVLTSHETGVKLIVGQETGEGKLNYLVCYTPDRRNTIAIEPQTGNVNSFNNGEGLTVLEPWDTLSGTIWVRLD